MSCARVWVLMFACVVVLTRDAGVGQAGYKLVEWPAPATSAAGFASPSNSYRRRVLTIDPRGTCSCCTAAPMQCSSSTAPESSSGRGATG